MVYLLKFDLNFYIFGHFLTETIAYSKILYLAVGAYPRFLVKVGNTQYRNGKRS